MFVSRKNLSLIQFVPVEAPARIDVSHVLHQRIESLGIARARGKLREPLPKSDVQRLALGASNRTGPLDLVLVGAECNVFHTGIVYKIFVQWPFEVRRSRARLLRQPQWTKPWRI
jgi:hypothetical protein